MAILNKEQLNSINNLTTGIYQHFKGKRYLVTEIVVSAYNETEGQKIVVYQALYGDNMTYARPWNDFFAPIAADAPGNVTGQVMRFARVLR